MDSQFLDGMRACRTLEDLYIWATKHDLDLRQYSRLVSRHLSDSGMSMQTMLEALDDAALRTLGNVNYFLVRRLAQPLTRTDTQLVSEWLKRHISLGIWSDIEISTLIGSICEAIVPLWDEQSRCKIISSLVDGLQSSTVFDIRNAECQTIRLLLAAVSQRDITFKSQKLGLRIVEALEPSQCEQLEKDISVFITNCIRAKARLHVYDTRALEALEAVPDAIKTLQCLPRPIAHTVVVSISKALILTSKNPEPEISRTAILKLLAHWWSSLSRHHFLDSGGKNTISREIEHMLIGTPLEVVAPYLRHLNATGKLDFLLQQWSKTRKKQTHTTKRRRPRHVLHQISHSDESMSLFIPMLQVLHQGCTKADDKIKQLFRLLQLVGMSQTIVDIIVSSKKVRIDIGEAVILHAIRTHMRVFPEMAQRIFCAYPTLALERCPDFAETLIKNPKIQPGIPFHYYVSRRPDPKTADGRGPLKDVRARAKLLEQMAVAYSGAVHLSPRRAYDWVYKCYTRHMSESLGSISREVVLAFTRAGIMRPLQQRRWVKAVKLRWILSLMRSVESPDVADEVDSMVYQWRGVVIRLIKQRGMSTPTQEASDMHFTHEFSWRWRRYITILKSKRSTPSPDP